MTRKITTGIILGLVTAMMSISIIPASASPIDNVCIKGDTWAECNTEIEAGQHVVVIFLPESIEDKPVCHYDVFDAGTNWVFVVEQNAICHDNWAPYKELFSVR